jgi:hypothetical protein
LRDDSARSNREINDLSMLDLFIRTPSAEDAAALTTASGDWLILPTNVANTLTQKNVNQFPPKKKNVNQFIKN